TKPNRRVRPRRMRLLASRARFDRQPHEFLARLGRSHYRLGEQDAPGRAVERDVRALGVDAGHAPMTRLAFGERGGVKLDRVGMLLVHVLDNLLLGLDQACRLVEIKQEFAGGEFEDAAEAAYVVGPLDRKAEKGEVGEFGVEGSLGV